MFNAGEVALLLWSPKKVTSAGTKLADFNKLGKALSIKGGANATFSKDDFITENQYYKAILKSNSVVAEPFYDWLSNEVLPALRKDGFYITDTKLEEIA